MHTVPVSITVDHSSYRVSGPRGLRGMMVSDHYVVRTIMTRSPTVSWGDDGNRQHPARDGSWVSCQITPLGM